MGAKAELQSVEEFFSTFPGQHAEARDINRKDGHRASASKQKSPRNHGQQQHDRASDTEMDLSLATGEQQQNQVAEAMGSQPGFSPLNTAGIEGSGFGNAMSPLSQANLAFAQHTHVPPFFPPDLLAMNFGQQTNGILQPLDRQLVFGGYSMDTSTDLAGGQSMMDSIDWESLAAGAPGDRGIHGRRDGSKAGMNGSAAGLGGTGFYNGPEASSAWFMPFNMEPPELSQDVNLSTNTVDPFAGMFSGGGDNSMNGLQ